MAKLRSRNSRRTLKRRTSKRKILKRKTPKRKTPKRRTPKRKTQRRKTPKRRRISTKKNKLGGSNKHPWGNAEKMVIIDGETYIVYDDNDVYLFDESREVNEKVGKYDPNSKEISLNDGAIVVDWDWDSSVGVPNLHSSNPGAESPEPERGFFSKEGLDQSDPLKSLQELGFSLRDARTALSQSGNDVKKAADLLAEAESWSDDSTNTESYYPDIPTTIKRKSSASEVSTRVTEIIQEMPELYLDETKLMDIIYEVGAEAPTSTIVETYYQIY